MKADKERKCQYLTSGFACMAVAVLTRILELGITIGRNPNCSAVEPPLRKAAGTSYASGNDRAAGQ